MVTKRALENNITKLFFLQLSQRRHFITLLALYFMTLPDSTAKQIGFYSLIGVLSSFIFELPSGYISDSFGHKKTLILGKLLMIGSMISFIIGDSFWWFALGAALLNTSIAFNSGTFAAFLHETLSSLGRDHEYAKIRGKMQANVSIFSMFLIIGLPFFTQFGILVPFYINLGIDIIGLLFVISLVNPKKEISIKKEERKSINILFKESKKLGLLPFSFFSAGVIAISIQANVYRELYLESLGFPIILLGFVMGLSRLVWFIVGHNTDFIKNNFSIKQLLIFDIFIFTISYILISMIKNPYTVGLIFILIVGYMWGRSSILEEFSLNNYLSDRRYKATLLSMTGTIDYFLKAIFAITFGFLMNISFSFGYMWIGIITFILLITSYLNIDFKDKKY